MDGIAIFLAWIFEGIGKGIVWIVTTLLGLPAPGIIMTLFAGAFLVWRVSLTFGPMKDCYRCGASGARRGFLGGRKVCSRCEGSGLIDRIGTKR